MDKNEFLKKFKSLRSSALEKNGIIEFVAAQGAENIPEADFSNIIRVRDEIDDKAAQVAYMSYLTETFTEFGELLENLERHIQYSDPIDSVKQIVQQHPNIFSHVKVEDLKPGSGMMNTLMHFQALCDAVELVYHNSEYDIDANFFMPKELASIILNPIKYSLN